MVEAWWSGVTWKMESTSSHRIMMAAMTTVRYDNPRMRAQKSTEYVFTLYPRAALTLFILALGLLNRWRHCVCQDGGC